MAFNGTGPDVCDETGGNEIGFYPADSDATGPQVEGKATPTCGPAR